MLVEQAAQLTAQQQQRCTIVATSPLNTACISSTVCLYHFCNEKYLFLYLLYIIQSIK